MPTAECDLERRVFWTELGWIGLIVGSYGIERVVFDCESEAQASVLTEDWKQPSSRSKRRQSVTKARQIRPDTLADKVELKLVEYAQGRRVRFDNIPLSLRHLTPFQEAVTEVCRKIRYGKTMTYGELAEHAGSPRAARAVGSVMANNNQPLLVPCHRVVGSQGMLRGFSTRSGMSMKQRLLDLESPETKALFD